MPILGIDTRWVRSTHSKGRQMTRPNSVWLRESGAIFNYPTWSQAGRNPKLKVIYWRLVHLLTLPVIPIFVLDGPSRNRIKRNKTVAVKNHWLTDDLIHLVSAFGFHVHEVTVFSHLWYLTLHCSWQAPGEAEAELANLNMHGVIDFVVTQDSDAFMFGATQVIRRYVFVSVIYLKDKMCCFQPSHTSTSHTSKKTCHCPGPAEIQEETRSWGYLGVYGKGHRAGDWSHAGRHVPYGSICW